MDSEPSESCPKVECIDLISSMPDAILGEILSYLSTEDAVATSILSTRWKNLFPYAFNHIKLDLYDFGWSCNPEKGSFVKFVDKLLNETLLHVLCVERIAIYCGEEYGDENIVSWVRAAVQLNVVYLELKANMINTDPLFDCLNGCSTLVELEFGTECNLVLPEEKFVLPNLKRLFLYELSLHDDIHKLLDGCPLLEDLSFSGCDLGALRTLYIQSSLLKKFFIGTCFDEEGCMVKIDAPNLETFKYVWFFVGNYVVGTFKCLHSTFIGFDSLSEERDANFSESNVSRLAKLLGAFSKTTRLCLSDNSIETLYCLPTLLLALHRAVRASVELPRFKNLTCLALGCIEFLGFQMLASLLINAPSLQTLTLQEGFKNCRGGYEMFESLLPRLPVCLKLCFKKVVIWDFKSEEDEIKLIEYFLKNGRTLQEVIVYYLPTVDTGIFNRLLMFTRRSQTCQILTREYDRSIDRHT